ncbi:hypothetical protein SO802_004015 [Lithocarpus litseifolius]|uniref:RNase H type-1 domain-containing protein n=1 Tax=Lithocarpus litseifolius TaxID=425828 RepID=A0AAW2E2M1_9ROSI
MKGIGWNVGSNSKLKFWTDNWVKGKSVRELIQGPIRQAEQEITIEEIRQGGEWHWNAISFDLPPYIKGRILATPIQIYGEKGDYMNWKASKDGEFTVASAYTLARPEEKHRDGFKGSWIWKINSLPRICHFLWLCHHNSAPIREKHRNRVVFENTTLNPKLHDSCLKQAIEYVYYVGKSFRTIQVRYSNVKWNKPMEGWGKLNSDEASLGNLGRAGGGRLIQDHRGGWVRGYTRNIGFTTIVIAKFWALRDRLKLALQLGVDCLEVELNAKVVVNLVLSNLVTNRDYSLLNDCRYLLSRFQQTRVNHTYREANRATDGVAKEGCMQQEEFVILFNPPTPDIVTFVNEDATSLYYVRRVANTLPFMAN